MVEFGKITNKMGEIEQVVNGFSLIEKLVFVWILTENTSAKELGKELGVSSFVINTTAKAIRDKIKNSIM